MKPTLVFLTSLFLGASALGHGKNQADESQSEFGKKITLTKSVDLSSAISNIKSNAPQLIEAQVTKVCKAKGCWMGLKNKTGDVRVTFEGYSFFVPQKLVGKTVLVQGKITEKKMTLKETKHYVEDDGGDPDKVTEPATEYRIVATGVKVKS